MFAILCAALGGCAPVPEEPPTGGLHVAVAEERPRVFGYVYDPVGIRTLVTAAEVVPEGRDAVFGMLTTDATGAPVFEAVTEVPHIEGLTIGWFVWVGDSTRPVQWKEVLAGPVERGSAEAPSELLVPAPKLEPPAAVMGEGVPHRGFVHHQWTLSPDDPHGRYSLTVTLRDGRSETFVYELRPPHFGEGFVDACPYMEMFLNRWRRADAEGEDPGGRDISEAVMDLFAETLYAEYGFEPTEKVNDAYWKVDTVALQSITDPTVAHGLIHMRTFADFRGRAVRTALGLPGELIDYQLLFEQPVADIAIFTRSLADDFAAKLLPHARHMCTDLSTGQLEEEARLERIREELGEQIKRIRRERAEAEQRRKLLLEVEEVAPEPSSASDEEE